MLVFSKHNLAFLAVPKTGTTAIEVALKPRADIIFTKRRKHINAPKFRNKVLPFLQDTLGVAPQAVAVMRDPLEQIRSWYRYRNGPRQRGTATGTHGCSFDAFVTAVISPDPPAFAQIGSQQAFLCGGGTTPLVEHLFAYEHQPLLLEFLGHGLGEPVELQQRNVSPPAEADLSEEVETALRTARKDEFDLHARVLAAGGYLETAQS